MLEPLYEKTIQKKKSIKKYFDNIQDNIDIEKVKKSYHEQEFTKENQDKIFAAIDGSFNKTKFMACFIYAIESQTIISIPDEGIKKESPSGDIDMVSTIRSRTIDSILSQHMNILELKSTIDTLQKYPEIDYMLMDGSIRGTLMNYSTNFELPSLVTRYLNSKIKEIVPILEKGSFPIEVTTNTLTEEILYEVRLSLEKNNPEIDINEIRSEVLRYFEGLEQLTCIKYLLEHYKEKIICISKTSSTKDFFNENIPDAAVLEYTCENPGYTYLDHKEDNRLVRYDSENEIIRRTNYPIYPELSDNTFTIFFTRLDKRANVLKIEIPNKIDKNDTEKIEEILNDLHSTCINGYPYILKKAHDEVIIKNTDMNNIINKLEVFEKTGRDMLK
ncbi:MAG: DNA double-strand break repair nuclease NurA [Methanobacteriaceae archaeon]|nr:DNA double-strand break repair nuclease NurA [Methanobacteriaceae archaeon]